MKGSWDDGDEISRAPRRELHDTSTRHPPTSTLTPPPRVRTPRRQDPRTVPLADEPFDPRAETWTGLVTALRDPRQSSAEAARELEAAARVAEENIRRADERGAVDPAEGFAPTLGVGLVSCGGCGRIIALDALARNTARGTARARDDSRDWSASPARSAPRRPRDPRSSRTTHRRRRRKPK